MIPVEVLRQIRRLRLRVRRAVRTQTGGAYRSAFKGTGLSFEEVRAYTPGDEVRAIDWNVTARSGTPFVKRYAEERELTVLLVLDPGAGMNFSSGQRTKRAVAAELGAVLALSAAANQDRLALVTPAGRVPRPAKGTRAAVRVVRELLAGSAASAETEFATLLGGVAARRGRRAIVFVFSDFHRATEPAIQAALRRVAYRHEVIAVRVADPRELTLPKVGLIALADAVTGEQLLVDTGSAAVRTAFAARAAAERLAFEKFARTARLEVLDILTTGDYFSALAAFFSRRTRRRAGR